jgi:flagellar basal-body rod protein FlgB
MAVSSIKLLENLIDFCSLKNKVISKNIANVGTQNYKREDVQFKSFMVELNSAVKLTNEKHIEAAQQDNPFYELSRDKEKEMLSGINNVDIDKEMSQLAENTLLFKFASRKIGDYYRGLQNVIKGGS